MEKWQQFFERYKSKLSEVFFPINYIIIFRGGGRPNDNMWGGRPKPWMSPNLNFVCQIGLPSNEMFFDNVSASTLVEHENKHDGQGGGHPRIKG